jgi:hypothetical protein
VSAKSDLPIVFKELKTILKPYAEELDLKEDTPEAYSIDGPYSEKWGKQLFFGAVQVKKNYVSFHLMPVYMYPELLKDTSPELKKRMQGKSCFNFKKIEPGLFRELAELTFKGAQKLKEER